MATRDDQQVLMGEADMALRWEDTLKHVPAVLALGALGVYGYLSICYDAFYRALGVDPADVGLSYAAILARSSGFVIVASFVILIFLELLLPSTPPSRPGRYAAWWERIIPEKRWRYDVIWRSVALGLMGALLVWVFGLAEGAARDVRAGHAVRPLRPPVPGMSIALTTLAIRADPVTVEPAGRPGDSPAADRLRGRHLLHLGQADGTVVFYDLPRSGLSTYRPVR